MPYEVAPAAAVQLSVTCRLPAVALTPVGAAWAQVATGMAKTSVELGELHVPLLALTT
jgi:hypothetical protein